MAAIVLVRSFLLALGVSDCNLSTELSPLSLPTIVNRTAERCPLANLSARFYSNSIYALIISDSSPCSFGISKPGLGLIVIKVLFLGLDDDPKELERFMLTLPPRLLERLPIISLAIF